MSDIPEVPPPAPELVLSLEITGTGEEILQAWDWLAPFMEHDRPADLEGFVLGAGPVNLTVTRPPAEETASG